MRYSILIPNTRHEQAINSQLPITHCLIGQRDASFERPSDEVFARADILRRTPGDDLTPEERLSVINYRTRRARSHYALTALGWVESEAAGEKLQKRFKAPEWDQAAFQLIPVKVITYGR